MDLALGGAANDLKAPVDVFPVAAELVESQPYPKSGSSLEISLSKSFKTPWRNQDRFLGTDKTSCGVSPNSPSGRLRKLYCLPDSILAPVDFRCSRTVVIDRGGFRDVRFPITVEVSLVVGADC